MFFTVDALVAHAVGDYILQSHWMATEKVKRSFAALVHVVTYSLPFLFLTRSVPALLFIAGTHFLIDRFRLARYVVWIKNQIAPPKFDYIPDDVVHDWWIRSGGPSWDDCKATGYPSATPPWLAVWLLIIADNIMHIILNGVALQWLA